ncbi:ATP-dependent zinc metalloprotease FtsH [uncultured Tyzzerella sp.]|uniref:ATP-dependent zinc metalloprotease FtsH n=1 Tax=uncultured Tyzzerella sp. TaxID=2321398 RepID=UPI002943417B|nr:ATP-dependent zinc metalloprotease FtsH [uncultured Tyzzerella sp.]
MDNNINEPKSNGDFNNNNNKKPNKNTALTILIVAIVLTFLFNMMTVSMITKSSREIDYSEFLNMLEDGKIEKVEVQAGKILIFPKEETKKGSKIFGIGSPHTLYTGRFPDFTLKEDLKKYDVDFKAPIVENNGFVNFFVYYILPILVMYLILTLLFRGLSKKMGGGMFGMGKSNAKVYMQKETGVTFKDVAGQEEAKESLREIVDFLNNPEKYSKIGAVQPKGALLVGPPGTGKTMLAKAVAGEANVTFLSIAGSDFVEMYVGLGASRVRSLYKQAMENTPCIVFIDEIDAIGKKRDGHGGGNDEREQTLNQLLSEMDGFDTSKGIVILAATNRPEVLDKALLRPGRFDRRIIVEKPDLKGREDILKVHAKKVKLDKNVDLKKIALATSGSVGADLANMVNEAALRAVRCGRELVKQEDLMEAVEVVIAGKEKKDRILSEQERRIVAYHEVGHALVSAMLKNTKPVQKITIVPRTMGSLGYTLQIPEQDKYLQNNVEMLEEIMVLLGGRCAEEVEFGSITTGASNDIQRATSIARSMVTLYGMSDKFDMVALEDIENRYLDGRMVSNCSSKTQREIDKEIQSIIKECHIKARNILKENKTALDKISEYLIEKENITGEEFMEILKEVCPDYIEKVNDIEKDNFNKKEKSNNKLFKNKNIFLTEGRRRQKRFIYKIRKHNSKLKKL